MATSIIALVEVCEYDSWRAVLDAGALLEDNYDLFGCLFGVRNYANFRPLFADRGLPANCSETCRNYIPEDDTDIYGRTWASYDELKHIDRDELATSPDSRIHVYEIQPDGTEQFVTKAGISREVEPHLSEIEAHGEARVVNRVFRNERLRRGEVLSESEGFEAVLRIMDVLAELRGHENVRLVACFAP
jgi:hypothetical protein